MADLHTPASTKPGELGLTCARCFACTPGRDLPSVVTLVWFSRSCCVFQIVREPVFRSRCTIYGYNRHGAVDVESVKVLRQTATSAAEDSRPRISIKYTMPSGPNCESWRELVGTRSSAQAGPIIDLSSVQLSNHRAAPLVFSRKTEHSDRHKHDKHRQMCSGPLHPNGKVSGCRAHITTTVSVIRRCLAFAGHQ